MRNSVSIIITHHNRLDQLYSQLTNYFSHDDVGDLEVMVVDSSPLSFNARRTLTEHFKYAKFIFLDKNYGPSYARNTGIKNATGKYIQFIDDDDLITFDKIRAQEKFLSENLGTDVIIGWTQKAIWNDGELPKFDKSKITLPDFDQVNTCGQLLGNNGFFQIGSALFKKSALAAINGFDENRWLIEDVDLYLRLLKNDAKFKTDKNLPFGLFWRINSLNSLSKNNEVLFLEGRILNYLFCVNEKMLKSVSDHFIVYSGIYNILKQDTKLSKHLYNSAIKILEKLSIEERFKYLPKEGFLSILIGYSNLFKVAYSYRWFKNLFK